MWVVLKGVVMTAKDKLEILNLKRSGVSLKNIAEKFSISIPYVKKIAYSVKADETYCIQCGKVIKRGKSNPRKFCSSECKRKFYKENPGVFNMKKVRTSICLYCHNEFQHYGRVRRERKFCSKSCAAKYRHM